MVRFTGKLVLVALNDKTHPVLSSGRTLWGLERDFSYRTSIGGAGVITVPRGFQTDLASIPRFVSPALPPDGPWVQAAVVHDFLYRTSGHGVLWGRTGITRPTPYTRAEADDILREAMADLGVWVIQRNLIWSGVRVGGSRGWNH
jgi:hypothetical protein